MVFVFGSFTTFNIFFLISKTMVCLTNLSIKEKKIVLTNKKNHCKWKTKLNYQYHPVLDILMIKDKNCSSSPTITKLHRLFRLLCWMNVIQMTSQLLQTLVGAELAQMTFKSKICLASSTDVRLLYHIHFRWNDNFLLENVHDWK